MHDFFYVLREIKACDVGEVRDSLYVYLKVRLVMLVMCMTVFMTYLKARHVMLVKCLTISLLYLTARHVMCWWYA